MAIHLTRIYTRTGDDGTSALGDMSRVRKTDPRLVAYADVDEANASLGAVLALGRLSELDEVGEELATLLRRTQNDLFDVGADLCVPIVEDPEFPPLRVTEAYIERLEQACDELNSRLPKLDSFILPCGTAASALLQVARTVTRRAERSAWSLIDAEPEVTSVLPAKYLNRLSDLLFIAGRLANPGGDVLWTPGGGLQEPPTR